ncbi:MAG: hypothetical protein ABI680_14660 [Chthoniobacteraceae bacterium]
MKVSSQFVAATMLSGATCWAAHDEISELLPWIKGNRVTLGMSRAEFTAARPAARETFPPDTPPPPGTPFRGGYHEGDLTKRKSEIWLYTFAEDRLRAVVWRKKADAIEAETIQIRGLLLKSYGAPTTDSLARMARGGMVEKLTRERYFTSKEDGFAIYLVATDQGGVEVMVMPVSDPDYPLEGYDDSFAEIPKADMKKNKGQPTIVDILAKVAGECRRTETEPH